MTTPLSPREQGMADFTAGKTFADFPYDGFRPEDIDQRWHWQKGWLRAQLEAEDLKRKNKP